MPNPVLIYIADSYRASTGAQIAQNIEAACHRARFLHGRFGDVVYPVVPHLMGGWHGMALSPTDPTAEYHLAGLVEVMRRCDAVWFPGNMAEDFSEGVQREFYEAWKLKLPWVGNLVELEALLPDLKKGEVNERA